MALAYVAWVALVCFMLATRWNSSRVDGDLPVVVAFWATVGPLLVIAARAARPSKGYKRKLRKRPDTYAAAWLGVVVGVVLGLLALLVDVGLAQVAFLYAACCLVVLYARRPLRDSTEPARQEQQG